MKIECSCKHIIFDNTDFIKYKGYFISDSHWFEFWNKVDKVIEEPSSKPKEREEACMKLRSMKVFSTLWECQNCGKLFIDDKNGKLVQYIPENRKYNRVLFPRE